MCPNRTPRSRPNRPGPRRHRRRRHRRRTAHPILGDRPCRPTRRSPRSTMSGPIEPYTSGVRSGRALVRTVRYRPNRPNRRPRWWRGSLGQSTSPARRPTLRHPNRHNLNNPKAPVHHRRRRRIPRWGWCHRRRPRGHPSLRLHQCYRRSSRVSRCPLDLRRW